MMRNNPLHIYITAYRHITAFSVDMMGARYEFCIALT
jgi:hypothetical protein